MRLDNQKWHQDCMAIHQAIMFETLIYPHNILTESVKSFVLEDKDGNELEPLRGYMAMKESHEKKEKYFIEDEFYDVMPLRVTNYEELFLKENSNRKGIIFRPLNPIPFRIRAEKTFEDVHQFIDEFASFEHSNPDEWTLLKICAMMGYIGKTFLGICSKSEFGKSSMYEIIHSLTKKSPVFQPRSVPGILAQITEDGNIVFDEVHESNAETKKCMENFTLQVAGNKPIYINGAMKSAHTKSKYNVGQQSITFLYNLKNYYSKPEEQFFDYLFTNNRAIDSRVLKIKMEGMLLEKFDRDFDMVKCAEENKMYYMKIAKMLLFLKKTRLENGYARRYQFVPEIRLKGRRKQIYDEIIWMIDMYSRELKEYEKFVKLFDKCIQDYKDMVSGSPEVEEQKTIEFSDLRVTEETIESENPLDFIRNKGVNGEISIDSFLEQFSEEEMKMLLRNGDIFELDNKTLKILE